METATANTTHDVIQKRRGTQCRYCRKPMEPGSPESREECPKRAARDEADAASEGLANLRGIGRKMQVAERARKHAERRSTRKKHK